MRTRLPYTCAIVAALACAMLSVAVGAARVAAQEPTFAPQKRALLVGVNEYLVDFEVPKLTYAESDVNDLEIALTRQGYTVTTLKGQYATHDAVILALERESRLLRQQDTFLLYIAGHGVKANKHVYWLAHNTGLSYLSATGLRLSHLMEYVADIEAAHKIVLLDHCYGGEAVDDLNPPASLPTGAGSTPPSTTTASAAPPPSSVPRASFGTVRLSGARNVDPTEALKEVTTTSPGALVLAASRGAAYEVTQFKHGLFTHVLLEALNTRNADTSADGNLSVDELRTYVTTQVVKLSTELGLPQRPLEDIRGSLQNWFIATGLPATTAADAANEIHRITDTLTMWGRQGRLNNVQRIQCMTVVTAWQRAVAAGTDERTLPDYPLLQTIRDVVSHDDLDLDARVATLVADLNLRGGVR